MTLTPVEIRHIKLSRRMFGYQRPGVDLLLEEIVESFEDVWRSRADYADKLEHLETEPRPLPRARGAAAHDARLRGTRVARAERTRPGASPSSC